jgi:alkyl hydroperoxide reductase subunit AhpF
MAAILDNTMVGQLQDAFAAMKEPVQILFFGSKTNCEYCRETEQLLVEVAATHERIGLSIFDLKANADMAARFQVDKSPAIVIVAKDGEELVDLGIRLSGIPAGHEFNTLVNDILLVSSGIRG